MYIAKFVNFYNRFNPIYSQIVPVTYFISHRTPLDAPVLTANTQRVAVLAVVRGAP